MVAVRINTASVIPVEVRRLNKIRNSLRESAPPPLFDHEQQVLGLDVRAGRDQQLLDETRDG